MKFSRLIFALIMLGLSVDSSSRVIEIEDWSDNFLKYDFHGGSLSTYYFKSDPEVLKFKSRYVRFFVNYKDIFQNTSGERTEIQLSRYPNKKNFVVSEENFTLDIYRFSLRLNLFWEQPNRNALGYIWAIPLQVHGPDAFGLPPSLSLSITDKYFLTMCGGVRSRGCVNKRFFLSDGALSIDEWVDFKMIVRWSAIQTGFVKLYRKNSLDQDWRLILDVNNVSNIQTASVSKYMKHYWRAGLYRSESIGKNVLDVGPIYRCSDISDPICN